MDVEVINYDNSDADLAEAPTKATFRSALKVFSDAPFNHGLNCWMMSVKCTT